MTRHHRPMLFGALMLLTALSVGAPAAAANLVRAGGFEGGSEAVAAAGWQLGEGVTVEKGRAPEGKAYLCCACVKPEKASDARQPGIAVKPNTGYVARCRFRAKSGGAHYAFGILKPDGSFLACRDMYACRTENWDESVLPFRTEGQTSITLYVARRYGTSELLFDSVELVEDDSVQVGDVSPRPNPFPRATPFEEAHGYIVSAQHWMRLIYPTYYPTRKEVVDRLACRLAPGEYEPVTFSLTSLRPLEGIEVRPPGDMVSKEGNVLPAGSVQVGIVRTITRWLTNGAPLQAGQRFERRPLLIYPNQKFGMPEQETRRVWLTVHAPPDQAPGLYRGQISVAAAGGPLQTMLLQVEVLPIRLADAEPTYGMYYRHDHQVPQYRSEGFYRRSMADMRAHGMNSVSVYANVERKKPDGTWEIDLDGDSGRYSLTHQMALLGETGLLSERHPLLLLATGMWDGKFAHEERLVQAVEERRRRHGWPEFLFYLVDEPGSAAQIATAKTLNEVVHRVPGVRTTTALGAPGELADHYDVWITSGSLSGQVREFAALAEAKRKEVWTYNCQWNGCQPLNDRYFCGYYMWSTGLRGNWQWAYTEGYQGSSRLEDELELKLPFYEDPWYVTYVLPTPECNIPTLGWEGRREGIDDYRYLQTLRDAVAEVEESGSAGAKRTAREARKFLREVAPRLAAPAQPLPATNAGRNYTYVLHPGMKAEAYDEIRRRAAGFLVKLQASP